MSGDGHSIWACLLLVMMRVPFADPKKCKPTKTCCRKNFLDFAVTSPFRYWHERRPLTYSKSLAKKCCARNYDVFFVGSDGMAPVVSVDNLLCDIANLTNKHIFRAPKRSRPVFEPSGLAYPGLDATLPGSLRRIVEQCLAPIVSAELGTDIFRIPSNSASSYLRVLTKPSNQWSAMQLFPHLDWGASIAATMGLADFRGSAVGFYSARFRKTDGINRSTVLKDIRSVAAYKLLMISRFEDDIAQKRQRMEASREWEWDDFSSPSTHFELLFRRDVIQNRAIAYPAWMLHRAVMSPEAATRLTALPEKGRLTLNLFYTNEEHLVRQQKVPAAEPSSEQFKQYLYQKS